MATTAEIGVVVVIETGNTASRFRPRSSFYLFEGMGRNSQVGHRRSVEMHVDENVSVRAKTAASRASSVIRGASKNTTWQGPGVSLRADSIATTICLR